MTPRAGESKLEKAARLRAEAERLKTQALLLKIGDVIKKDKMAMQACYDKLVEDGFMQREDLPEYKPTPAAKKKLVAICDREVAAGDGEAPAEGGEPMLSAIGSSLRKYSTSTYDRNKSTLGDVSIETLMHILTDMDDICYSPANLKALIPAGKRQVPKEEIMKIIERNTDKAPTDRIEMERRNDRAVAEDLFSAYQEKGRRGSGLKLPPDYSEQGPYSMDLTANVLTIKHNFEHSLDVKLRVPPGAKFYFDQEWSQSRCLLRQRGGGYRKLVAELFTEVKQKDEPTEVSVTRAPRAPKRRMYKKASSNQIELLALPASSSKDGLSGMDSAQQMKRDGDDAENIDEEPAIITPMKRKKRREGSLAAWAP